MERLWSQAGATSCSQSQMAPLRKRLKHADRQPVATHGNRFAAMVRRERPRGVPCIRGLRIPVATVVGMVADGLTTDEILAAYPDLEAADVEEALRYAAQAVQERELPLAAG